jgi:hypothetical protein
MMKVKIYKPAKNAMQSGRCKTDNWVIEAETTSGKKPEQLMGWTSSEDTLSQIKLSFTTLLAAVEFTERKGWHYVIVREPPRRVKPRNYMDNFRYVPGEETVNK